MLHRRTVRVGRANLKKDAAIQNVIIFLQILGIRGH
jgi:hypothetical protein